MKNLQRQLTDKINIFLNDVYDLDDSEKSEHMALSIINLLDKIDQNYKNGDLSASLKDFHSLKHSLLFADLDELSELAKEIENCIRDENIDMAYSYYADLIYRLHNI